MADGRSSTGGVRAELRVFTAEEHGDQHCQFDLFTQATDFIADWLDSFFNPRLPRITSMSAVPQIYLDHLSAVTGPDPASLRDSWEPDGVLEFPYAVSLAPTTRFEGADAIADFFARRERAVRPIRVHRHARLADRRQLRLRARDARLEHGDRDGHTVRAGLRVRFGLSERGRLAWMREFWDPTRM